jgi:hypothetical protein
VDRPLDPDALIVDWQPYDFLVQVAVRKGADFSETCAVEVHKKGKPRRCRTTTDWCDWLTQQVAAGTTIELPEWHLLLAVLVNAVQDVQPWRKNACQVTFSHHRKRIWDALKRQEHGPRIQPAQKICTVPGNSVEKSNPCATIHQSIAAGLIALLLLIYQLQVL